MTNQRLSRAPTDIINSASAHPLRHILDRYHQLLAAAQATSDLEQQVLCRNYVGATLRLMGRWNESHRCHTDAIPLARQLADGNSLCLTITNLGGLCSEMGRFDEALKWLTQGLDLARQTGNRLRVASALGSIGKVYLGRGQWQLAIRNFSEALLEGKDDPRHEMCSNTSLALAHSARGDFTTAESFLLKARDCAALVSGKLLIESGAEERGVYDSSFTQQDTMKCRRDLCVLELAAAEVSRHQRRHDEALAASTQALATAEQLGYSYGAIRALIQQAEALRALSQPEEAADTVRQALQAADALGAVHLTAESTRLRGMIFLDLNQVAQARQELAKSVELFNGVGDSYGCGRAQLELGVTMIAEQVDDRAALNVLNGLLQIVSLGKIAESPGVLQEHYATVVTAHEYIERRAVDFLSKMAALQHLLRSAKTEGDHTNVLSEAITVRDDLLSAHNLARVISHWASLLSRLTPKNLDIHESLSARTLMVEQAVSILRDGERTIEHCLGSARHVLGQFAAQRENRRLQALQTVQIALPGFAATTIYLGLLSKGVSSLTARDLLALAITAATWASSPVVIYRLRLRRTWRVVLIAAAITAGFGWSAFYLWHRVVP